MRRLFALLALFLGSLAASYVPGFSQQQEKGPGFVMELDCSDIPQLCDCPSGSKNCAGAKMGVKIIQFLHSDSKSSVRLEALGKEAFGKPPVTIDCSDVPELCK